VASVPLANDLPPGADACSADKVGDRCVRLQTHRLWRWITGSPYNRNFPRRDKGLPGYWAVLFARAVVQHPAGSAPSSPLLLFEKIHGGNAIAFANNRTLGIRNAIVFEATYPRPTRSRAYASLISLPRPSQGSLPARAGSPLAGQVSHLQDNRSKFHGVITIPPIPIDQQSLVALFVLCSALGSPPVSPAVPTNAASLRLDEGVLIVVGMALRAMGLAEIRMSTLLDHVTRVVRGGSKEHVRRIHTTRIVAAVKHPEPIGNRLAEVLIGKAVTPLAA
jgi:hypothetical protein